MKGKICTRIGISALAGAMVFSAGARAQERHQAAATTTRSTAYTYDATRETTLLGTVVSYTEEASRTPIGAHVTIQTATGTVDVHLGPASYLRSNHFSLAAGDSVRFVGVNVAANGGSVFLARIAQKGTQALAVRSPRGFLMATTATRAGQAAHAQNGQQDVPR